MKLFLNAAEISQDQLNTTELGDIKEVVKVIGRLPLAVDQAAAFFKESRLGMSEILEIYTTEHVDEVCWTVSILSPQERPDGW